MRCRRSLVALVLLAAVGPPARAEDPKFLGKAPHQWIEQLKQGKGASRRAAAFALGKLGAEAYRYRGVPPLVACLGDPDTGLRDAAAYALGEIGLAVRKYRTEAWTDAGPALLKALSDDKDPRVRRSAAYALGGFGEAAVSARGALQQALQDNQPMVRQNAAWALGQLRQGAGPEGVGGLCGALGDKDALVRRDAAIALGEVGRLQDKQGRPLPSPAARPLLERFKHDPDATVRQAALESLVSVLGPEDKDAAADLRPFLIDPDREKARAAALALASIGGREAEEAVAVLRQALAEESPVVLELVTAGLANIKEGAAAAVPDLIRLLGHKEPAIRRNAALALANIGPRSEIAVPELAKHLYPDEPDPLVRRYAAEALALIGEGLGPVIPKVLRSIQEDKDRDARHWCVYVLFRAPEKDFEASQAVRILEDILNEKGKETRVIRYDAARCLARQLRGRAPEQAVEVLLEMLTDPDVFQYHGSGANLSGGSLEGGAGGAAVQADVGGDARFMAAEALGAIGPPKARKPEVIKALQAAAKADHKRTREAALHALEVIQSGK